MQEIKTFSDLGLSEETLAILDNKGFVEPSPIQAKVIPALLSENCDIIGQAQTGTGKTAAFGIPILENLVPNGNVQAVVLTPTRELAIQVCDEMRSLRGDRRAGIVSVYGGTPFSPQLKMLQKGADIVVGTPGRILDHLRRGSLDISAVSHFILDEADEMLNMGFIEDIEEILSFVGSERRMLLFSATMPPRILGLAKRYMGEYRHIAVKSKELTADLVDQSYMLVRGQDRFEALCRIIDSSEEFYGIVFCRTRFEVKELANQLIKRHYRAEGLHGEMSQNERERVLKMFKAGRLDAIVATDVAARGIDVNNLTHVVNYGLPQNSETYVHRIGRTGRAGKTGVAVSIVETFERRMMEMVSRHARCDIKRIEVPSVEEIKKGRLSLFENRLKDLIEEEKHDAYLAMAYELVETHGGVNAVAALLKAGFHNELLGRRYGEVQKVEERRERRKSFPKKEGGRNKVKLFIARGKKDGFTSSKLAGFIEQKSGVRNIESKFVDVMESFSFAFVHPKDADTILKSMGKIVKKAHDRNSGETSGGDRRQGDRRHGEKRFGDRKGGRKNRDQKR